MSYSSRPDSLPESSGLAVFRHTDFTLYQVERFSVVTALEMQSVAVGWQVYEITRRPLDLGLVGLALLLRRRRHLALQRITSSDPTRRNATVLSLCLAVTFLAPEASVRMVEDQPAIRRGEHAEQARGVGADDRARIPRDGGC
jgi:hypothetical protein